MLEVILFRHGKSDWDADYGHDSDRPLAGRGRRAAAVMGRMLSAAGRAPDLVLSSPARRAVETAEIARDEGEWTAPLQIVRHLYGGGPEAVLMTLRTLPESVGRPILIGHEPTWSTSVEILIGGGDVRMPTAAAAGLEVISGGWAAVGPGTCRLAWLVPPRLFGGPFPAV